GPRPDRPAADTVNMAIDWLGKSAHNPFLLWVHLYDPHEPYESHQDEFADEFTDNPYDAEIAYMDRHIGRLLQSLKRLGVDDRTLIVIAGDHGEGLGDHHEATHGYLTYNTTMHVPLMLRLPGQPHAGLRIASPASLVDI